MAYPPSTPPEQPTEPARQPGTGAYPTVPQPGTGSYPTVPQPGTGSYPTVPRTGTGSYPTVAQPGTGSYPTVPRTGTGSYPTVPRTGTGSYPTVPQTGTGSFRTVPPPQYPGPGNPDPTLFPEPPQQPKVARAALVGGVGLVTVAVTAMVVTVFNVVTAPDTTQVTAPTVAIVGPNAPGASGSASAGASGSSAASSGASASPSEPPASPTQTPGTLSGTTISGFPNESNTGWQHTGVTLTAYRGDDEITRDGTVLEGKDLGCIFVRARNVVIKKSRVSCSGPYPVRVESPATLWIEDTEITGKGSYEALCIAAENYTALRVNCHGVGDGMRAGSNVTIQDSYIHDLQTCGDCHNDGIQSTGGSDIVIRHNYIENKYSQTSCVLLGEEFAPLRNVRVENNLFNGGGYSLYGGGDTDRVSGIKIINNRFKRSAGGGYFANGGSYGPAAHFDPGRPGNEWRGNVWDDNGKPVGY